MGNSSLHLLAASKSGGSSLTFILPFILIIAVFYFLLMRPQRNRQRRIQETQNAITPGQRIRTTAGIYGTVVATEDDDLILEIAPDVEVRILRRAVMDVLPGNMYSDGSEEPEEAEDTAGTSDADSAAGAHSTVDASADGSAPADGSAHVSTGDAATDAAAEAGPGADGEAKGTRAREK